jgi:rubrerythrin
MRKFLNNCQRIEEFAGKIYQFLASDRTYSGEVRQLFQKLSNDEQAHARHINLVLQADEKEVDASEMISWEKINDLATYAELLFQQVERGNLNEEKALRLAVEMEQQFVKIHIHNALHFRNQKLSELFNKLGRDDEEHLNTLKNGLNWWRAKHKPL